MPAIIAPLPIIALLDNNGQQAVGGQLFTYAAGTTTKLATYTDASGATPNTNPIILDDRGEAPVWLTAGVAYKFVFAPSTDTDPPTNPYWTVDNITGNSSGVVSIGGQAGAIVLGAGLQITGQTLSAVLYQNYLSGLTLSTAGSSTSFGVSVGLAADSTNVQLMSLPTAFTKMATIFTAGSGGGAIDVGGAVTSSWYHIYIIQRADTGAVDILASQSPGRSSTVTITIASPGVITWTNHGLQAGAPVEFSSTGALPTGIVAGTVYYVLTVNDANNFTIAPVQGGTVINTSGSQSGVQTAAANPQLPPSYTLYRRIGSMLTNSSGQWTSFVQVGDLFQWAVPTLDVATSTLGASAALFALNTPRGVSTIANMIGWTSAASQYAIIASSPLTVDTAPVNPGLGMTVLGGGNVVPITLQLMTDVSSQIRLRSTLASTSVRLTTQSWIDGRGRSG